MKINYCPHCGVSLKDLNFDMNFCFNCGQKICYKLSYNPVEDGCSIKDIDKTRCVK